MTDQSAKRQRLAELEKRLSSDLISPQSRFTSNSVNPSHLLDRSAVLPRPVFASTKINQRHVGFSSKALKSFSAAKATEEATNPYLQKYSKLSSPFKLRSLKFHEPGRFIEEAKKNRKAAHLLVLSKSVEKRLIDDLGSDFIFSLSKEPTPELEWWDEPMASISTLDSKVYHFPPMQPAAPQSFAELKPVMLTKQESRKLRRQRRLEAQKKKREQIRLGLLPPEESKLKMSNYMKVLGQQALEEPTRAEALVRKQIKARLAKHHQTNAERALSPEERKAKKVEHWKTVGAGSLSAGSPLLHVAAFITPILGTKERFKLMVNGGQMQLHGIVIKLPDKGIVLIEGSLRAMTHYKKLVLSRMKWPDAATSKVVWQGTQSKSIFAKLAWHDCESDSEARSVLREVGFAHILKSVSEVAQAVPVI